MKFLRTLRTFLSLAAMGVGPSVAQDPSAPRPNILFLLVDDWGAGDVDICDKSLPPSQCPFQHSSAGRSEVLFTPRIKQMAEEGQIMSNWYAPRGICSPSRAGLLAGRDPVYFAMEDPFIQLFGAPSMRGGFPSEESTVAGELKSLGYTTAFSGKWHLGFTNGTDPVAHTPINLGYDEAYYFVEGSNGEVCENGALNPPDDNNIYHCCAYDHVQHCEAESHSCEVMEQPIRWENITSRHLQASLDWIDTHKDDAEPWFLSHHFLHVHIPWVPGRNFVSHPTLKRWTDMVSEVDWAVGVLLDKLRKTGLDSNTMVVLTSDNGPFLEKASSFCPQNCKIHTPEADREDLFPEGYMCTACDANTVSLPTGGNTGGKGMTWEGGQHVLGLLWWPGKIPAGSINPIVSSSLDFFPTAVALAGGTVDKMIDGKDLSPSLFNPPDPASDPEGSFVYFCGVYPMAVRTGRYKVVWRSQNFVGKKADEPTSKTFCAGTGNCCVDSPTQGLCTCQWATTYDPPIVIDLIANPSEDPASAIINPEALVNATKIREDRVRDVMIVRGFPYEGLTTEEQLDYLSEEPNLMQVDFCWGHAIEIPPTLQKGCLAGVSDTMSCPLFPEECQLPEFEPYQNCSIKTYQGATCQKRLPCGKQDGYKGPFEYVRPTGSDWDDGDWEQCGAYKYGANSYFPDNEDLQLSVCAWQDDVNSYLAGMGAMNITWCRLPACVDAADTETNYKICDNIKKYGLDNVPSGYIYNSPFPDDQSDMSLMYPNQNEYPNGINGASSGAFSTKPAGYFGMLVIFCAIFTAMAPISPI